MRLSLEVGQRALPIIRYLRRSEASRSGNFLSFKPHKRGDAATTNEQWILARNPARAQRTAETVIDRPFVQALSARRRHVTSAIKRPLLNTTSAIILAISDARTRNVTRFLDSSFSLPRSAAMNSHPR